MFVYSVLSYPRSILRSWLSVTLEFSVSGQNILEMAREAGADISDAVNKCVASILKEKHKEQDIPLVVNLSLPHTAVEALNVSLIVSLIKNFPEVFIFITLVIIPVTSGSYKFLVIITIASHTYWVIPELVWDITGKSLAFLN